MRCPCPHAFAVLSEGLAPDVHWAHWLPYAWQQLRWFLQQTGARAHTSINRCLCCTADTAQVDCSVVGEVLKRTERQVQAVVQALLVRLLSTDGDSGHKNSPFRKHLPQFLLKVTPSPCSGSRPLDSVSEAQPEAQPQQRQRWVCLPVLVTAAQVLRLYLPVFVVVPGLC